MSGRLMNRPVARPPGVVVLGMHRSGTSAVTHALTELGLHGVADAIGADWSNPDGHWESWRLMQLNNRLLQSAGGTWDDPPTGPLDAEDPQLAAEAAATLHEVLPVRPWLWKDPRLSFTLPFWRRVLDCSGSDAPAAVLCLRNPLEVAASLERRNGMTRREGLILWERYTNACLENLDGLAVFVSRYEDFLADQTQWCRQVTTFLSGQGILGTATAFAAAEAGKVARPELRRHRFAADDVARDGDVTPTQRATYTLTRRLSTTPVFRSPPAADRTTPADTRKQVTPSLPGLGTERRLSVWVAGFPSRYGGADTELDHVIDLFLMHGVEVNLVPVFPPAEPMVRSVLERGGVIHDYRPDVFRDRVVVSFCNGEFLARLPEIVAAGRPSRVIWFNCMTWTFEAELTAHANGWIDYFGFESDYQRGYLGPQIEAVGPYRTFGYRPFFEVGRVAWEHRDFDGTYRVGRISRDDGFKFAEDTWRIFDRVLVPRDLDKKVYILGYGPHAAAKVGPPPEGLDWLTWMPDAISSTEFYRTVDTLIHKTGGSRESYGRVVVEAYAHGVVPVVEDAFAFGELVVHGETGFRGGTSDELSHYASLLAFDPVLHRRMAAAGREHLESMSDPGTCFEPWLEVL
jgi:hypothetical protein